MEIIGGNAKHAQKMFEERSAVISEVKQICSVFVSCLTDHITELLQAEREARSKEVRALRDTIDGTVRECISGVIREERMGRLEEMAEMHSALLTRIEAEQAARFEQMSKVIPIVKACHRDLRERLAVEHKEVEEPAWSAAGSESNDGPRDVLDCLGGSTGVKSSPVQSEEPPTPHCPSRVLPGQSTQTHPSPALPVRASPRAIGGSRSASCIDAATSPGRLIVRESARSGEREADRGAGSPSRPRANSGSRGDSPVRPMGQRTTSSGDALHDKAFAAPSLEIGLRAIEMLGSRVTARCDAAGASSPRSVKSEPSQTSTPAQSTATPQARAWGGRQRVEAIVGGELLERLQRSVASLEEWNAGISREAAESGRLKPQHSKVVAGCAPVIEDSAE